MRLEHSLGHILFVFVVFLLLIPGISSVTHGQQPATPAEASQFDFWVGQWDLTWQAANGQTQTGTNSVSKILDGRVIEERFDGGKDNPLKGISHSVYVSQTGQWKQTWVDNNGGYLDFTGGFRDGKMTLSRSYRQPGGAEGRQRMVFFNIRQDSLDWSWENSADGGKTWNQQWKIRYERKQ